MTQETDLHKISGMLQPIASNFWEDVLDPRAVSVRHEPQKVSFVPNLSPPRVL